MNAIHREILEAIVEMGVYASSTLSRRTELSEPLVEQLVEELHALGYIERIAPECEARCLGCPRFGRCDGLRPPSGWALTSEGLAMIRTKDGKRRR